MLKDVDPYKFSYMNSINIQNGLIDKSLRIQLSKWFILTFYTDMFSLQLEVS